MDEVDDLRLHQAELDTHPRWVFRRDQGLIIHLGNCQQCRAYAMHRLDSSMSGDLLLDHALHQQCNSFNTQLKLELARSNTALVERAHDYSHLR
jgi:hypothetical protein